MTIEYKIVVDEARRGKVDKDGRPLECYTFTINGQPSGKWFRPCQTEGMAPTYFVERCIGRLKQGRSSEAFGGPEFTINTPGGEEIKGRLGAQTGRGRLVRVEREVTDRHGRVQKRDGYKYVLDGKECQEVYANESQAKEACAVAAFMSRGKLGQLEAASAALEDHCGANATCKLEGRGFVGTNAKGERFAVGFLPGGGFRFKKLGSAPPPAKS